MAQAVDSSGIIITKGDRCTDADGNQVEVLYVISDTEVLVQKSYVVDPSTLTFRRPSSPPQS